MKSRTLCFDITVLKKDITRFFPAWAIYLIGGLLVTALLQANSYSMANTVLQLVYTAMPLITVVYALVNAMLLFGDLCNSRLCNALHAMPLRREGWFLTHFVAGLLMQLVPHVVLMLVLLPGLGQFFYVALIWLAASALQYLFFFGLATLCMFCCGNRIGAVALYGLGNYLSMLVYWVIESLYVPLLYGVRLRMDDYIFFGPMLQMMNGDNDIELDKICNACDYYFETCPNCTYQLNWGDGWAYLGITAGLGVAFAALALLLYRRRKLECAGDFAAVKPVRWIFTILASVCGGMVFRGFAMGGDEGYILLICGIIVGFFLAQMLLQRRVKVFDKKNWLRLGAFLLIWAVSLGLTAVDAFGIESRIPNIRDVEKVLIADRSLSDTAIENGTKGVILYDKEEIGRITAIHQLLLEEEKGDGNRIYTDHNGAYVDYYGEDYRSVTIHYTLKNGTTMTRIYQTRTGKDPSDAWKRLSRYFDKGSYVLGWGSLEALTDQIDMVQWDTSKEFEPIEGEDVLTLLKCLWYDAEAGNLSQSNVDYSKSHTYLELYELQADGLQVFRQQLYVSPQATKTWAFLTNYAKTHNIEDWFY